MASYVEYKMYLKDHILEYLPEEYQGAAITFEKRIKERGMEKEGIAIKKRGANISPILYLPQPQDIEGIRIPEDMPDIFRDLAQVRMAAEIGAQMLGVGQDEQDYEKIKPKIYPSLMKQDWNKELLSKGPSRNLSDLAIQYRIELEQLPMGRASIPIPNEMMEYYHVTEEDLYQQCIKNIRDQERVQLMGMMEDKEIIEDASQLPCNPELLIRPIGWGELNRQSLRRKLLTITDREGRDGAGMICDPDLLPAIAERAGQDIVVLPSSTQELILAGADDLIDSQYADQMVQTINETQVEQEIWLSDHAYAFSREGRELMTLKEYEDRQMEKNPMWEVLRRTASRHPDFLQGKEWDR